MDPLNKFIDLPSELLWMIFPKLPFKTILSFRLISHNLRDIADGYLNHLFSTDRYIDVDINSGKRKDKLQ